MTVSSDDIPRPKPQQKQVRFRYRGPEWERRHLKQDAEPADAAFIHTTHDACVLARGGYPALARLRWDALVDYCMQPPKDPILADAIAYCHAHLDSFSPNAQDFIKNMMDNMQREKRISDKQIDYLWDLFNKLVRKRR